LVAVACVVVAGTHSAGHEAFTNQADNYKF